MGIQLQNIEIADCDLDAEYSFGTVTGGPVPGPNWLRRIDWGQCGATAGPGATVSRVTSPFKSKVRLRH